MKYIIEVSEKGNSLQKLPFIDKTFLIGSSSSSDIPLNSSDVSQKQAKIIKDGERILIYNLGKSGDVCVNGKQIKSTILDISDIIKIKEKYTIRFAKAEKPKSSSDISQLRSKIHRTLIKKMDLEKVGIEKLAEHELWQRCENVLDGIIRETEIPDGVDLDKFKKDILNEALALGPLEELLTDEGITEIMVNGKDMVYIERKGKIELTDLSFTSDEQVVNIISRIVNPIGRRIDESVPMVDARLSDGSRVNAIIPPLSLKGPMITIRKFSKKMFTDKDLINFGTLTEEMAKFLEICVKARKNTIISGGTGSGKTCLLNALSSFIPLGERILTIEDSAELRLSHKDLGSLEARPANIEGKGAVTIRDLVRNALRMRPDRIVIGECRGGEAIDMLQAMNTGHDGSLTTVHANSASDAVLRLETMVMMSGLELPFVAIRRQIASAVNIIVQIARFSGDGSRKIISVNEIKGMHGEEVDVRDIFVFKQSGIGKDGVVMGDFIATGYMPEFIDDLKVMGLEFSKDIFEQGRRLN